MEKKLYKKIETAYAAKESVENPEAIRRLERHIILDAVDRLWQEHLYAMDGLRTGISLRAYAQKDPLVEYKHEAFNLFSTLMADLNQEILNNMFRSATTILAFEQLLASLPQEFIHREIEQFGMANSTTAGTPRRRTGMPQVPSEMMMGGPEEMEMPEEKPFTMRRDMAKIGRNDDCPCGSGKKYKKCCGK